MHCFSNSCSSTCPGAKMKISLSARVSANKNRAQRLLTSIDRQRTSVTMVKSDCEALLFHTVYVSWGQSFASVTTVAIHPSKKLLSYIEMSLYIEAVYQSLQWAWIQRLFYSLCTIPDVKVAHPWRRWPDCTFKSGLSLYIGVNFKVLHQSIQWRAMKKLPPHVFLPFHHCSTPAKNGMTKISPASKPDKLLSHIKQQFRAISVG